MNLGLFLRKSAIISPCGLFRYEYRREWDESLPPYVLGALNPSTADHEIEDATTTRTCRRAEANGCGSVILWNLGAGRATDPSVWKAMADPIGPENDAHIRRILTECRDRGGIAVAGWGAHGSFMSRDRAVLKIAREVGVTLQCLGTTKDGQPRHPLYISNAQPLVDWSETGKRGQPCADESWSHEIDRGDEEDDPDKALMNCGLMRDGTCSLAGTEWCDWDCPFAHTLPGELKPMSGRRRQRRRRRKHLKPMPLFERN